MPVKESLMVMIITMIMVNEMVFCKTLLFFCISGNIKQMTTIFTLPKGKKNWQVVFEALWNCYLHIALELIGIKIV